MAKDSSRGTDRIMILRSDAKRRRGKPPLDRRIERAQIAIYVLDLQRADPAHLTQHVEAAAEAFRCEVRTVWRALHYYRPPEVKYPTADWGPQTLVVTDETGRRARLPADVKWGKPIRSRFAK
jgi:hypothetical protein